MIGLVVDPIFFKQVVEIFVRRLCVPVFEMGDIDIWRV